MAGQAESALPDSAADHEEEILLPISHVAEIQFCERNFYYRMVEQAEDVNEHVLQGRWEEEKRAGRETVRRESGLQTRGVMVHSIRLGIIGVIDVLEESGERAAVVEFKKGALRENANDDVQLCAQAMAWEDMTGGEMECGYVYYHESRRRRKVWLTEELREAVLGTIERARGILEDQVAPAPVRDARCEGCSLRSRCLPDEVSYLITARKDVERGVIVRPTPAVNLGRVLYLQDPGLYVHKDGWRLKVTKEREVIREIPVNSVDEVVCATSVQWSSAALQLLFTEGIPLGFITQTGRFAGGLQSAANKNSLLRTRQFEFRSSGRRWELARLFSLGKLQNMRVLMLRHDRDLGKGAGDTAHARIGDAIRKLKRARERDEILGLEGMGSREYFQRFANWVEPPFSFAGRVRRPASDPVNAMLSYGYSLLTNAVLASIQLVGLDPFVGFLHESVYGRPALVLDIMEEFRPIVVDSVVLRAVNQHVLDIGDFERRGSGVWMSDAGRRAFCRLFDNRMKEELRHPLFGYTLTYRRLIELQVRFLAKVLTGEIEEYAPLKVR